MRKKTEVRPRQVWYLLIHQLPKQPLYLRARIRQRLARVGAVALKRSVYVLPRRRDCLEDFQWIAQEAGAGGGEAYVCEARFLEQSTDSSLVDRFRAGRDIDYRALAGTIRAWRGSSAFRGFPVPDETTPQIAAARKRFDDISRIDFFEADGRRKIERLLERIDKQLRSRAAAESPSRGSGGTRLLGRTWVTRRGIQVDRIASAWFVRRFVDRKARFRFFESGSDGGPRAGEISFDMVGGEYTHEGDRCTLETLVERTGVADRAVSSIAEVVHDIDLKDGKFGRPEAPGVEMVLTGLILANPEDQERLERGTLLFDELYQSFRIQHRGLSKEAS